MLIAGSHDLKASGSKRKQSAGDGLCEVSSEASEPGEGGGLRRSKRRKSGGDKRAHEQGDNGASKQKCCHRSNSGSRSRVENCTAGKLPARLSLGHDLNTPSSASRPTFGNCCSLHLQFVLASRVSLGQGGRHVLQVDYVLAA